MDEKYMKFLNTKLLPCIKLAMDTVQYKALETLLADFQCARCTLFK